MPHPQYCTTTVYGRVTKIKAVTIWLDEDEFVVNKPIGKDELIDKIYQFCGTLYLRFTVVTQEVIIYSARACVIFFRIKWRGFR